MAGLYAWWTDEDGRAVLSASFDTDLPALIYAGQTGATSKTAGIERLSTLRDRIGGNHLGGNIRSSTFRKTLAAALRPPLGLELEGPNKLTRASNAALTAWMHEHLRVATIGVADRAALAGIEEAVLELMDPPLNLMGMPRTPLRIELSRRRSALGQVGPAALDGQPTPMLVRSETAVVAAFCNHLQAEGWAVEQEVDFVDIKATRDGVTLLAEAKGITTSPGLDVDTLYGQLLRRIEPTDAPTRYVVLVPEKVRPKAERVHESVRARLGIEIVSIDETGKVHWQPDQP